MSELRQLIAEEIRRSGPIPFARFMELALYCPKLGYYERLDVSPGRTGDFYTSVSVGGLFGELLAFQFAEWLTFFEGPRQIVEAGAHDGSLARDILAWLASYRPRLLETIEYWIIEPSAERRITQAKILERFSKRVRWFESWEVAPSSGIAGVIFSNELLDAFPVRRICWQAVGKEWREWAVALDAADDFTWTTLPLSADARERKMTPDLPEALLDVLPNGFTTECCPAAVDWWRKAARALKIGRILAFDYGLEREEFFVPERSRGTLRGYCRHRMADDLLACPGEQDLTAHANFSEIKEAGELEGLSTSIRQSQAQFLTGILGKILKPDALFGEWTAEHNRQFQTLTHPEHLGRAFRVLVQQR